MLVPEVERALEALRWDRCRHARHASGYDEVPDTHELPLGVSATAQLAEEEALRLACVEDAVHQVICVDEVGPHEGHVVCGLVEPRRPCLVDGIDRLCERPRCAELILKRAYFVRQQRAAGRVTKHTRCIHADEGIEAGVGADVVGVARRLDIVV